MIRYLKARPEHQHVKEWEFEAEVRLKDQAIEELNEEIQPKMIGQMKQEYKEEYGDEWEARWEAAEIFKPRTERRYWRRYDMPIPFRSWDYRNTW